MVIAEAVSAEDVEDVRVLMRTYGEYLAGNPSGAASICLGDYERELGLLPGPYGPPDGVLLLARHDDGRAAGCVAFKRVHPEGDGEGERACEMKRLWVGETARGLGLGRRLIEAGIAWARGAGYGAIYLDTVPAAMPEANELYRRLGFEAIPRYNRNPVADLAFFRLTLD